MWIFQVFFLFSCVDFPGFFPIFLCGFSRFLSYFPMWIFQGFFLFSYMDFPGFFSRFFQVFFFPGCFGSIKTQIMKSRNDFWSEMTSRIIKSDPQYPKPLYQESHPGFFGDNSRDWRLHHFPGNPVPIPDHSTSQGIFILKSNLNFLWHNFEAFSPHPITRSHPNPKPPSREFWDFPRARIYEENL